MHQYHVLRVFRQQHRLGIERIHHGETHCTMTLPIIFGWIEQKYGYVPGLVNV